MDLSSFQLDIEGMPKAEIMDIKTITIINSSNVKALRFLYFCLTKLILYFVIGLIKPLIIKFSIDLSKVIIPSC